MVHESNRQPEISDKSETCLSSRAKVAAVGGDGNGRSDAVRGSAPRVQVVRLSFGCRITLLGLSSSRTGSHGRHSSACRQGWVRGGSRQRRLRLSPAGWVVNITQLSLNRIMCIWRRRRGGGASAIDLSIRRHLCAHDTHVCVLSSSLITPTTHCVVLMLAMAVTCSCDRRTGASRNATGIKARPKGRCVPSSAPAATTVRHESPLSDGKLAARSIRRAAAVMWPACANAHAPRGDQPCTHARTKISRNVASTAADWCCAGCCKDAAGPGAAGRKEGSDQRTKVWCASCAAPTFC